MPGVIATIPRVQFSNAIGLPMSGGTLTVYLAGTTTPTNTWQNLALTTANTNPIALDSRGECVLWLDSAVVYKFVLKNALGVTQWTEDNISGAVSNFTGVFVKSADLALSGGAAGVGTMATGAGAIARTQQAKNRDVLSVKDFGAVGDGTTNDTAAIQAAITSASANGKIMYVPAGTYMITPATLRADEAGANVAAFVMVSNMHLEAEIGAIFKIADGVSTDGAPLRMSMFFSNSVLNNICIRDLTIDMNGANNKISPSRGVGTYNIFTQAAIIFSGTSAGVAASATDVLIESCKFLNTAGVSSIVMGQSNTVGTTMGRRWIVRGNLFNNNGLDTNDHSSVYGWADDVICDGNTFTSDVMWGTIGSTGGFAAYEIHGANHRVINNKVRNYYQAFWVSTNYTSDSNGSIVANNDIGPVRGMGIDFYRDSAAEKGIINTLIHGNVITLSNDSVAVGLKAGIQIPTPYAVYDLTISNNIVRSSGVAVATTLCNLTVQSIAGQAHDRITLRGNRAVGTTFGAYITTNATNGLGTVTIENNEWHELLAAGAFTSAVGITVSSVTAVRELVIRNNSAVASAVPIAYGVYLSGAVTTLYFDGQFNKGVTNPYFETALTVTTRNGQFDNMPWAVVFGSSGGAITLGNGTFLGRYAINGQQITIQAVFTVGSTTVIPSGNIQLAPPFSSINSGLIYQGSWRLFKNSTPTFYGGTVNIDGGSTLVTMAVNGALFLSNTSPVALASGDVLSLQITYTRAA